MSSSPRAQFRRRGGFALALAVFSLVPGYVAFALTSFTILKGRMPYNSEGNYFDGMVVHHAGYEFFYGLFTLPFWALFISTAIAAYWILCDEQMSRAVKTLLKSTVAALIAGVFVASVSHGFDLDYSVEATLGAKQSVTWRTVCNGFMAAFAVMFVLGVIPLIFAKWHRYREKSHRARQPPSAL